MKQIRLWSGTIACLLVAAMGVSFVFGGMPAVGIPLTCAGLALGVWRGVIAWRGRPDPYDLSRLWEHEPDEPDEDEFAVRDLAYCHICGHAVAEPYARCPDCGNALR